MKMLEALLEEGRASGVFSYARAQVLHCGKVVFDAGNASADAHFDLASVSKVVCTTAVLCRLAQRGALDVLAPVKRYLPNAVVDARVIDLALHRSGLPAFVPFFAEVAATTPALFEAPAGELREQVRRTVVARALKTPAVTPVGTAAVYSDVGFIVLGELIVAVLGRSLDDVFITEVAAPLGLSARFRRLSVSSAGATISTGGTRPREPAPGQEGLWAVPSWPSREGEVDDDNAWVMNGVAGHAGVFGSAADVARFGQAVLEGWVSSPTGWHRDAATKGSTRAFGFDTPSAEAASCGPRFGRGPRGAVGHLGFTGTSLWIDFDRQLVVALLTNRVISGRANVQIRAFRPRFHDAVLDALE